MQVVSLHECDPREPQRPLQLIGWDTDPVNDQPRTACSWCGTSVEEVPVTWTLQSGARGIEYLCESCTRENVRKIEGSLPTEYW